METICGFEDCYERAHTAYPKQCKRNDKIISLKTNTYV